MSARKLLELYQLHCGDKNMSTGDDDEDPAMNMTLTWIENAL